MIKYSYRLKDMDDRIVEESPLREDCENAVEVARINGDNTSGWRIEEVAILPNHKIGELFSDLASPYRTQEYDKARDWAKELGITDDCVALSKLFCDDDFAEALEKYGDSTLDINGNKRYPRWTIENAIETWYGGNAVTYVAKLLDCVDWDIDYDEWKNLARELNRKLAIPAIAKELGYPDPKNSADSWKRVVRVESV